MEATISLKPADLLPPKWGKTAESIDQVVWLGSHNIRAAIRFWRLHVEAIEAQTKRAREQHVLFKHLTPEALEAIAKEYSNPKLDMTPTATLSDGQRVPAPDPVMLQFPAGSTTFNLCGWCRYARGERRADLGAVFLNSKCDILVNAGWEEPELRFFHTPCLLPRHFPGQLFSRISERLATAPQRLGKLKETTGERIRLLLALEKLALPKPAFSSLRPPDWLKPKFTPGLGVTPDLVVYFVDQRQFPKAKRTGWINGKCWAVDAKEEAVNVSLEQTPPGWNRRITLNDPLLQKPKELDYLGSHSQYAYEWVKHAELGAFTPEYFMSALTAGGTLR